MRKLYEHHAFWRKKEMQLGNSLCKYPGRDLNPHDHHWPRDFKSRVSTGSTTGAVQKKSR